MKPQSPQMELKAEAADEQPQPVHSTTSQPVFLHMFSGPSDRVDGLSIICRSWELVATITTS